MGVAEAAEASMDSDLAQALRSSLNMISSFGKVVTECSILINELSNVSISCVKRSANLVAHEFARASILYPDRIFSLGMSQLTF